MVKRWVKHLNLSSRVRSYANWETKLLNKWLCASVANWSNKISRSTWLSSYLISHYFISKSSQQASMKLWFRWCGKVFQVKRASWTLEMRRRTSSYLLLHAFCSLLNSFKCIVSTLQSWSIKLEAGIKRSLKFLKKVQLNNISWDYSISI